MVVTVTDERNNKSDAPGSSSDHGTADAQEMAEQLATREMTFLYVEERIRQELAEFRRTHAGQRDQGYRALGRKYGVSHVHIMKIEKSGGVGDEFAATFAKKHFEDSTDAMRRAAWQWQEHNPRAAAKAARPEWMDETKLAYPRMFWALGIGFDRGIKVDLLRKFARAHMAGGESLTAEQWWDRLKVEASNELLRETAEAMRRAQRAKDDQAKTLPGKPEKGGKRSDEKG